MYRDPYEMFEVAFYDNNYRLLCSTSQFVAVYEIVPTGEISKDGERIFELKQVYKIDIKNPATFEKEREGITVSGRRVKKVNYNEEENLEIIHSVSYDDEMEILAVLMKGHVYLYNNLNGKYIKKVKLEGFKIGRASCRERV